MMYQYVGKVPFQKRNLLFIQYNLTVSNYYIFKRNVYFI